MSSMTESDSSRRKYSRISISRRAKLVQLITEEQYTIAKAAKRLGIKASTARMILNKYKQTGDFPMKQFKRSTKIYSKKRTSHLNEIPLLVNKQENMSPQARNQVSQITQDREECRQEATGMGCNLVYFWVCPDYTSYHFFIL